MIKFREYISITMLLVLISDLFSQNTHVILDMQVPGGKTVMINHSGKVVKEFSPNEKVQFDDDFNKIPPSLSHFKTYVTYDFANGPLPVKTDSTWKTYDINGKMVMDFGSKYKILAGPSEGIYKAYDQIKGKHREFNIIYIDKDGQELFEGRRFFEGSQSMNNIIFAKEGKESKQWLILNTKDGTIKEMPISISKLFYTIKYKTNGYPIGTFQSNYNEVILDIEGNIVFDPTEVTNGRNVSLIKITDEFIVYNTEDSYYFINKEFKLEKILDNQFDVKGISNKYIIINNEEDFDNVFNLDFSKAKMPLKENEVFMCTDLTDEFLGGVCTDTITKTSIYKIIDANTMVELGKTDENIDDIFQDMLIAVDPESSLSKLVTILNYKGEKIYEVDPSSKIYKGIKSTRNVEPTKVKYLEIKKDDNISSISKFINLEFIEFKNSVFTELPPDIKKLTELKEIRFFECDQLKSLPKWLSTLKFLEKIDIFNCKNLRDIDLIVPTLKSLKNLSTVNYTMSQSVKDQLKKSNPNLIIHDSFRFENGIMK
jgi:hypothetical protein